MKTFSLCSLWALVVLFATTLLMAQESGRPRGADDGLIDRLPAILMGTIQSLASDTITIRTETGATEGAVVDEKTVFLKETRETQLAVNTGDRLLVGGISEGDAVLQPAFVVVRAADVPEPPKRNSRRMMRQGPVEVVVTALEPLTVKMPEGESRKLVIGSTVRLTRESVAKVADFTPNSPVRALCPMMPGHTGRTAVVITLLGLSESAEGAQPRPPVSPQTALQLYFEIHCENPNIQPKLLNSSNFAVETSTLESVAKTLEKHGARGTFLFTKYYPLASLKYEGRGESNTIVKLARAGHQIGLHVHAALLDSLQEDYDALKAVGVREIKTVNPGFIGPKGLMLKYTQQQCTQYYLQQFLQFSALGLETVVAGPFGGEYRPGSPTPFSTPVRVDARGIPDAGGAMVSLHPSRNCKYNYGWRDIADESSMGWQEIKSGITGSMDRLKPGAVNYFAIVVHDHQFTVEGDIIWNHRDDGKLIDPQVVYAWKPSYDSKISPEAIAGLETFMNWADLYVSSGKIEYSTHQKVLSLFVKGERR